MLRNAEADRLPGSRVLETVRETLAAASRLEQVWTCPHAVQSLASPDAEIVKLAIGYLALNGEMRHVRALATVLHHRDECVARLAEDALWRIWMRAGSERGNLQLRIAIESIGRGDFAAALRQLVALAQAEPDFAEAHHQRGLVLSLLERFDDAEEAMHAALKLNPQHFEALAGLGHIAANRGDAESTLLRYHSALRIHPRYAELRSAADEISAALHRRSAVL